MVSLLSVYLLAATAGILALQLQPELPGGGAYGLGAGIVLFFFLARIPRRGLALVLCLGAGALSGFGWAAWRAELRLADALDPDWEGRDIRLVGEVQGLPQPFERGERFEFRVRQVETPGARLPERLLLSYYSRAPEEGDDEALGTRNRFRPGESWRLTVRLKRPHGLANPGGFDYEAWLLERNLRATGYVRPDPVPERLSGPAGWAAGVDRLRQVIRERFYRELGDAPHAGILVALAVGDQGAMDRQVWALFARTGVSHLFSVSGIHVTLVGTLLGLGVGWCWRRQPRLCLGLPAQRAAILAGWGGALAYALLAGFGIPAQRTCLMLTVAALALLAGRRVGVGRILVLALAGVLVPDPWAVLAPGFWLSFGTVAALVWISQPQAGAGDEAGRWRRLGIEFGRTQWAATLATLPVLLWVFQQFSLVSPLANLLAIPLVSLVITPLVLLAAALVWIPGLPLLALAHALMAGLVSGLDYLAAWPLWQPAAAPAWALGLALLGVTLLLMPRGVPGKGAGLLLLGPLLFWVPEVPGPGELRATVLDVGQGQAVLLETAGHSLLYDAGPAYGQDDAGRRVVLPYLARRGIGDLDALVVSHRDGDHAGGLVSIQAGTRVERLYSSLEELGGEWCRAGLAWEWDGVAFRFLHPRLEPGQVPAGDNGSSCVLKVTAASGSLLLAGDIGTREEAELMERDLSALSADVLLMPHHGSTSSSSLPFVAAVGPRMAVASAGYRNRFGHPRAPVLERYEGLGSQVWRTDRDGALVFDFGRAGIAVQAWRQAGRRYWWGR